MDSNTIPRLNTQEPVTLTPYAVTASAKTIDPFAIRVQVLIPSGTVATIQTDTGVTFTADANIDLSANGRPMSNTWSISRLSGVGTVTVLVYRVTGRASTNA